MKISTDKRQSIAQSQKVISAIAGKLKESNAEVKDKVDLTKIAEDLAERRVKARE